MKPWYLLLIAFYIGLNACATHTGMITSTHPSIPEKKYAYEDIAVGYSKATYLFGIGGLDQAVLINEAKRNALANYQLKSNQILANTTLDIKTTWILPYKKVEAVVVADVIQLGEDYDISYASKDLLSTSGARNGMKPGDEVIFINEKDNQLVTGRIVDIMSRSMKVFYTSSRGHYLLETFDDEELFKTKDVADIEQRIGYKIGDTMRVKTVDKNRRFTEEDGTIIGLNNYRLLYRLPDGTLKTHIH